MAAGQKTGGRKKGTPNKTTLRFRDHLEKHRVNFEEKLAEAILSKDIEMIKALKDLLPYLQPKITAEAPSDQSASQPTGLESLSTENLLQLVKDSKNEKA